MIELTLAGPVAEITLARAAIDPEWVTALGQAVEGAAAFSGVRSVLLRADGPAFSFGGDLEHFAERLDALPAELDAMVTPFHRALQRLAELPVPVVCAAQGAIAGGGLGLLWASDVVLVTEQAKLAAGFPALGLSGDGGSSWYLPRLVGVRRATQIILQGRVLNGREAVHLGLADEAVPPDELDAAGRAAAERLAAGATRAYGEMRRLIRGAFERTLGEGLDAERAAMLRCGATADAREGILAFTERRAPRFTGT